MNIFENIINTISSNPILLVIYSLYTISLKGFALWRAARNSHKYWFVGMLVLNLFGIPEILYLLYFSKKGFSLPFGKNTKEKAKK